MTSDEVGRFLAEQPIVIVATLGRDGWPHVTPLWYVMRDGEPWIFTYAGSQKVRNLERDPRATLLVETGGTYGDLRGVMIVAHAEIDRDPDTVGSLADELLARYAGGDQGTWIDERTRRAVRDRAAKRVAVRFRSERVVSWDHSKLGGGY